MQTKKNSKFYAICLLIACLAAAMLGYAIGGQVEQTDRLERLRTPENATDYQTVEKLGVEAQGTYNDYEASVADQINDRRKQ